jgi:hypothetical protein
MTYIGLFEIVFKQYDDKWIVSIEKISFDFIVINKQSTLSWATVPINDIHSRI